MYLGTTVFRKSLSEGATVLLLKKNLIKKSLGNTGIETSNSIINILYNF